MKNNSNIFRLHCEPKTIDSCEEHHTQLIEYDVRMQQEEKKYSRLLTELTHSRFLNHSNPYKVNELDGLEKYSVDQTVNTGQSSELEATRLTGDEILHGCGLTMEQVLLEQQKSPILHNSGSFNRTTTQYSIAFQCTLSLQERHESNFSLMGTMQVACPDVSEFGEREFIPWQSVMIESSKFDVQPWTGEYCSSLPVPCKENGEKSAIVYNLRRQNRNEE